MRLRYLLLALFISLTTSTAFAAELEPFPKVMTYRIAWNGIKIGRVIIETSQNSYSYRMSIDTKTTGLAKMFSPLKSVTSASGRYYEGQIVPQRYSAHSTSDEGKDRTAKLSYDGEGTLIESVTEPKDDPSWRPEVSLEDAQHAFDPVTAFFVLRERMFMNVSRHIKDTTVSTFDGRRLADFTFKAVNNGTKMRDGKIAEIINSVVFRKPVQGYTPKELKKFDEGDPKIHVYFSADERFIPLEIEVYHWSGKITGSLEE